MPASPSFAVPGIDLVPPLGAADGGLYCRVHPSDAPETLIYLPGLHGDWTLAGPFRQALADRMRFVEFTYPRGTQWNLDDYAKAVGDELLRRGITSGWLLGESFSSQVAWAMVRGTNPPAAGSDGFAPRGIILAGGFVRHPVSWGVRLARALSGRIPIRYLHLLCSAYGRWVCRRGQLRGEEGREIDLFVARRTREDDRQCITGRYDLIRDDDLRPTARGTRLPVFALTGAMDPIVPWPAVMRWLRLRCPGYGGGRVIWSAGHNVLLDAPEASARQILSWIEPRRT